MTMREPRTPGPRPSARDLAEDGRDCTVAVQALCRGDLDARVLAVAARVAGDGNEHIALRFGRVLIYLEDRAALESLARIVRQAQELAEAVFGAEADAFTTTEQNARRHFERTRPKI